MTTDRQAQAEADNGLAAALLAVDPAGLGGLWLRALPGPARDNWLALLRALLPDDLPIRRVPLNISDDRLLGGLDLAATLRAGRPMARRGLLAEIDGGVAVLAMAERLPNATAARIGGVLDTGTVTLQRDGLASHARSRFGVVALDEGMTEEECPPSGLIDRLAMRIDLTDAPITGFNEAFDHAGRIPAARALLPNVDIDVESVAALCGAAMALGIASVRAPILASRAARAAAALAGRRVVAAEDTALAARLVYAWRATRIPATDAEPDEKPDASEPPDDPLDNPDKTETESDPTPQDAIIAAAQAALPPDLLSRLLSGQTQRGNRAPPGRSGDIGASVRHGRPIGTRPGDPRGGARLHVVETLKAAAPWQRLRRPDGTAGLPRFAVRRDDFRIIRFRQRVGTTTIFAVDASGSAAAQRLAEAKGAVELLLADCYIRRDRVALVAFRGRGAELVLPPTGSLVRAKRGLAGLPGGGGTPLAAGIDAAFALAETVKRAGQTPILTVLTDGRANIARDGNPDRPRADAEAHAAARRVRAAGFASLLIDVSPRPKDAARLLAASMGARYLPLPYAGAAAVSNAVRSAG